MTKTSGYKIPIDYYVLMFICGLFAIFAFATATPMDVMRGFWVINTSRSVLVSDYIAMAGLSATLINAAVSCLLFVFLLIYTNTQPNGKIIATLFLTLGFSMFGKNLLNTLPLCVGVWCYAKVQKARFGGYLVHAMCVATISPIVSEIAFSGGKTSVGRLSAAYAAGIFIGFIFPVVVESVKRMHNGYCLYNSGIAGGFIATFAVGLMRSMGVEVIPENYWDTSHTVQLAVGAFSFSFAAIVFGLFVAGPKRAISTFVKILSERDRDNNDYLLYYGGTCYINIGVMCIIATTTMLLLDIPINGPVLGGIITIAGFSVAGKHVRNTIPVLVGSILATNLNTIELATAPNALSILFSTGLAPIACKFGWIWGIIAGFLHVSVAIGIGALNGGLNLYNNGFAGGFVAITLVPLILFFNRLISKKSDSEVNYGRRKGD
ncbi:MAG: DUF1576 domain-containing protein [Oscillospiraceae bacterium]|nr:DUF1576 domain-containing protein [Oscillospiraceae bacterium]